MNKKRILKLLPALVLALLLVGDGVFYALTSPARLFSAPPSFGSGESLPGADANSDSSAGEGETDGITRPDFAGADGSAFPAFGGTEGGTPPTFGGTQGGTPPDFAGDGTFPGGPPSVDKSAFRLMRWRVLCLPVGALLMIAEVVVLLRLRRKKDSSGETVTTEELDPAERRMRSERRTRRIGIGVLCGVLILALVLQLVRSSMDSASSVTVNEEVRSAEAAEGTLEHSLQSAGIVASAEEETLSVPGSVKVTQYLVSDGDAVEAGDDIAVLERSSVLSAIADVQTLLEELDEAIDEVLDSSTSSYLTAPTGATVVKVYAKSGETVTDVMYDHGALALLSLDDLLAVKIDNPGGYTIGDGLTVTDGDGHSETGRVSKVEKDALTVTVELEDFSFDEKVTVTNQKGEKLGKDRLFVYSPLRITGYSGTVKSVHRSAGASVSKGSKLFTLSDGERTAEYKSLLRKRSKLVEQYNRLVNISKTGRLTAAQAGLISGLDQTLLPGADEVQTDERQTEKGQADKTQTAQSTGAVQTVSRDIVTDNMVPAAQRMSLRSGGAQTMGLCSSNVSLRAMVSPRNAVLLSADLEGQEEPEQQDTPEGTPDNTESDNNAPENGGQSEQDPGTDSETPDQTQEGGSGSSEDSPESGQTGDPSGDESQKPKENTVSRSVSVRWQDKNGAALTKGLPASLTVTLKADGEEVDTAQLNSANGWSKRWQDLSAGASYTVSCDVPGGFTGSTELSGDSIVLTFTQSQQESGQPDQGKRPGKMPKMPGKGKTGSMNAAFGQGDTGSASAASEQAPEEEDERFTMEETTLGTCISNDRVCVDVSVDELDVNSVTIGQEATVTLDALEGQAFTGTVTALSASGTNEGGNTKYTMTVTMDKDSSVLLGMSASVRLVTGSGKALLLPEAAIVEERGKTWVYTSYDEKKDELGGLTEVTTGAADGERVEILSGLEAGTTCWYRYADSIRYSFMR